MCLLITFIHPSFYDTYHQFPKNASKIHKDHSPIQLYILSSFLPSLPFFYLSHPKPQYNIPYRIPNPPTAGQKKAIATSLGIVPILPSQKINRIMCKSSSRKIKSISQTPSTPTPTPFQFP